MIGEEFSVGGNTYRTGNMSALIQFDVARGLGAALAMMSSLRKDNPSATDTQMAKAFCGVAGMLPQQVSRDALNACLGAAQRKQQTGFAPLIGSSGALMFQDVDLIAMLTIAWRVLDDNGLVNFFDDSLPNSSAGGEASNSMQ